MKKVTLEISCTLRHYFTIPIEIEEDDDPNEWGEDRLAKLVQEQGEPTAKDDAWQISLDDVVD